MHKTRRAAGSVCYWINLSSICVLRTEFINTRYPTKTTALILLTAQLEAKASTLFGGYRNFSSWKKRVNWPIESVGSTHMTRAARREFQDCVEYSSCEVHFA